MGPDTTAILDCWERLDGHDPLDRAVGLVATFHPDDADAIDGWPVGRRDAAMLALRTGLFGAAIRATADCPACGATMELGFTAADVAAPPAAAGGEARLGERTVALRPVTTRDLRHALASDAPRLALARACIAAPLEERDLPAAAAALQAADPQADLRLDLACEGCGTCWTAPFDVPRYVWTELGAWARRRLGEVHRLAAAYGWSERDILALSPARRDHYLALCAA